MEELFATFGINTKLLLIQGVNFGITLVVLWWFLWRPLMKMIAARADKIAEGVAAAERAKTKEAEIHAERSTLIAEARTQAENIVAVAEVKGKEERTEIVHSAQERAASLLKDAEAQAAEMKRGALAESEKEMARMAILAAEKILQKS